MIKQLDIAYRARTFGRSREHITGDQRTVVPVFDYADKTSPCRESCPAGHDISWALHLLQAGEFEPAHRLFLEESPFPAITGRVCYHPCETWCNRKDYDEPIAINALERAMADYGSVSAPPVRVTYPDQPVAVIGSGPAGVTVAYHLALLGYPVTMFEKDDQLGGALRYGIPRYRLPDEVLDREFERLTAMGIDFRTGVSIGSDMAWDEIVERYAAVFAGVGKPHGLMLSVPGVDSVNAVRGVDFLRRVNTGLIGELDGDVAVIGGGDVAIDCARSAIRLDASAVRLYSLESRDELPAHPVELREAIAEGLYLNAAMAVDVVEPADGDRIRLTLRNVMRFVPGEAPELGDRTSTALVNHLICAIGQKAEAAWLPPEMWNEGRVVVDERGQTPVEKVFSGGDASGTYNVVEAIGGGKRAAIGIDCYLRGWSGADAVRATAIGVKGAVSMRSYREWRGGFRVNGSGPGLADVVQIDRINLDYFPERKQVKRPELAIRDRHGFAEVNAAFIREDAVREAQRCFNCSECTVCGNCFIFCPDSAVLQKEDAFFAIDGDHCKGCGICVKECPRSAMTMVVEGEH